MNQNHQQSFPFCVKCGIDIIPVAGVQDVMLKTGACFHRSCFTCDICTRQLDARLAMKGGHYYHADVNSYINLIHYYWEHITDIVYHVFLVLPTKEAVSTKL